MSAFNEEQVLSVHHWTDTLFSFTTTRDPSLRFSNGHFTMIGLRVNDKPLLRAYSIVSPLKAAKTRTTPLLPRPPQRHDRELRSVRHGAQEA